MSEEVLLVLSTWPDAASARSAALELIDEKLTACANILPGVESIYRWQGQVETAAEVLVFMKTTAARYAALESRIKALHSYEVPEILCLRASAGLPAYLQWIADSCDRVENRG